MNTNIEEMAVTVRNLWHDPSSRCGHSHSMFAYDAAPLFQHRGVSVYRNNRYSCWDYVLGDAAITQRGKPTKEGAIDLIDAILDGLYPVSNAAVAHIRANGHTGLTYDEACEKDRA